MDAPQPAIFVSYAHEDQGLAHDLAAALERHGARVWLDQGELLIGDSLIDRIAEAIAEFDFVAALVSEASVRSNWCRKEIALAMTKGLMRGARRVTVLPLRVGDVAMPPTLTDVKWASLDPGSIDEAAQIVVADARRHLGRPAAAKPAGSNLSRTRVDADDDAEADIRIVSVDTEGMGRPRNDGSQGSALYRVPLVLSRTPPREWADAFPDVWNHPPAWTMMHRPGIATVQGDRIVLDGTTIDELERYHLKTLKLVVRQLNTAMREHRERQRARAEESRKAQAEHEKQVQEAMRRLNFDDGD